MITSDSKSREALRASIASIYVAIKKTDKSQSSGGCTLFVAITVYSTFGQAWFLSGTIKDDLYSVQDTTDPETAMHAKFQIRRH